MGGSFGRASPSTLGSIRLWRTAIQVSILELPKEWIPRGSRAEKSKTERRAE